MYWNGSAHVYALYVLVVICIATNLSINSQPNGCLTVLHSIYNDIACEDFHLTKTKSA